MTPPATALVFGARGAIGGAVSQALAHEGYDVIGTSRTGEGGTLEVDPVQRPDTLASLDAIPEPSAVVWAQGTNVNDAADGCDVAAFESVMAANCTYVVATLGRLVETDRLGRGARLCVISSIWQEIARPGKFSYTVSKAALGGLVRAASVDLAPRGILVNAVLPGVTDTPMTRAMLSAEQVDGVARQTGFGRLPSLGEVAAIVTHLCSADNTGVTGQSVRVDLGFSHARHI